MPLDGLEHLPNIVEFFDLTDWASPNRQQKKVGSASHLDRGDSLLCRRLDPEDIAAYLKEEFEHLANEEGLYKCWLRMEIKPAALMDWVDDTVAKEWGPHAGARVWNIINEGFDGEVEQMRSLKPHELPVTNTSSVPGSYSPARNLFHVSQALSWVAGTRRSISERLEYMRAIPALIEPLSRATESV